MIMKIKRKPLVQNREALEPKLGPRARKLHNSVDPDYLQDAVVLNAAQDGFVLAARAGERLVVTRPLDGGQFTSVCLIRSVVDGPDGLIELYDETRQQPFAFTPNSAAVHYDTVQIKLLGSSRVVHV